MYIVVSQNDGITSSVLDEIWQVHEYLEEMVFGRGAIDIDNAVVAVIDNLKNNITATFKVFISPLGNFAFEFFNHLVAESDCGALNSLNRN